ncbi:Protein C2-DOMAIN ABA-RELATED 1 [Hondaea fermentalgiana]|uniref:Protein C2-DOMAIN ABA-RELATED 1 n=1 Tax=Hondaea fermentalgiana TaxID=2315210 RepID=A0A2R5GRN8_9STRA|nr:Protein C2-DOMAIN ABA-RELATED 1 [Hondaea fermentalgiana]|eukprot:GBG33542.1 Protein C2-DOMAIN ABA-RELATED 1 [Hondaea fermentalgiana]
MGRGQVSEVNFDDVYGHDEDSDFEAVNPGARPSIFGDNFFGIDDDDDEDDEDDEGGMNAELEVLPSGIIVPERQGASSQGSRKLRNGKRDSKRRDSKRRDSKKRTSWRRGKPSSAEPGDPDSTIEEHELLVAEFSDEEDNGMLNDDGADDFILKKRRRWFNIHLFEGVGGGAMSGMLMLFLGGPALAVKTLSVVPWIKDWHLHMRILVQDAAFGNPPGFPFEWFLTCERLDIEGSISFAHLRNWILRRKEKVPLSKVPDFERYFKVDFSHVEVSNAMCNFQMFNGKFNINEFTRILADADVRKVIGKSAPFPNQLRVRVLRAKNLAPHRLKKTCDPYVTVCCRRQAFSTHTQTKTLNPMWNEVLTLNVDDASTVIEISVYDRDSPEVSQAALIGHWVMTAKYLVVDPKFNWHYEKDYKTYRVGSRDDIDGATGFEGWVPLATRKWKKMGLCGQLQIEVLWSHVPEDELENPFVPARRYTALEQLSQQSKEDQLRFGDWARFRDWLNHEPYDFDIHRFTVRDTKFYVQDLFRGHKGVPEQLVLSKSSVDGADAVKLPFLEMRKQFRPRPGDEGITCYDAFVGFFIGLLTTAARSGRLGSAIAQILSGGVWNFGYKFRNLLRGEFDKALVPLRPAQIKGVARFARTGFHVLHQNMTQNRRNRQQFKSPVEADDADFLSDHVELSGHLDRCAVKVSGDISNADMASLARRRGVFKTKYFELKGDTLFYRKHQEVPKGVTYNLTYKLSLDTVYAAVHVKSLNELVLNVQEESHVVRLREPMNPPPGLFVVRLRKWIRAIRDHEIPFEEVE